MQKFTLLFVLLYYLSTLSAQPDIRWQRILGGRNDEKAYDMIVTKDGGLLLVGYTTSSEDGDIKAKGNGDKDFWILKLDNSSPAKIQWEKNYGSDLEEVAFKVLEDNTGHFMVVGKSGKAVNNKGYLDFESNYDYWLMELNANGVKLRDKVFGSKFMDDYPDSPAGLNEYSKIEMLRSEDGNLVIMGDYTMTPFGTTQAWDLDVWWLKLDWTTWEVMAENKYDYNDPSNNRQGSLTAGLVETPNGDFFLCAYSDHPFKKGEYWLLKIDSGGEKIKEKVFGGSKDELPYDMLIDDDGNIIVVGRSTSNDGEVKKNYIAKDWKPSIDIWVIKLNQSLDTIWSKVFGGIEGDMARSVFQAKDGGYYIGGSSDLATNSSSNNTGEVCYNKGDNGKNYLIKIKKNGDLEWTVRFGGTNTDCSIYAIAEQNNRLTVAGYTNFFNEYINGHEFHGGTDMYIVQFDNFQCQSLPKPELIKTEVGDSVRLEVVNAPTEPQGVLIRWSDPKMDASTRYSSITVPISDTALYMAWFNYNCCFSLPSNTISVSNPITKNGGDWIITPNNDGRNDSFDPFWLSNVSASLTIFNLWGQIIFEEDPYVKDWEGTCGGHLLPEGVYLYLVKINETNHFYKGTINIRRY